MKYETTYGDRFDAVTDHEIETYLMNTQKATTYAHPILFRRAMARRMRIAYGEHVRWTTTSGFVADLKRIGFLKPIENL